MGVQLIFAVESNKKSKSDWIYIKDTIEHFYPYDRAQVKLSPVYMGGKGNYKGKEKEIARLISQYGSASRGNLSRVIYCFDCDDHNANAEDRSFLTEARRFCEEKGYDFVWFCKDIECVYLERPVEKSQKTKAAGEFKAKKRISGVDSGRLSAGQYQENASNILCVIDQYLERKGRT